MYNLQDALTNISIEDIMSKVSEYELWKYYCPNFETIDKSFKSELYKDNNPACRIYYNNGKLLYKDFGTQQSYSVLEYIKTKYNCTYKECLNIINNDFKITKSNIITSKDFKLQYLKVLLVASLMKVTADPPVAVLVFVIEMYLLEPIPPGLPSKVT